MLNSIHKSTLLRKNRGWSTCSSLFFLTLWLDSNLGPSELLIDMDTAYPRSLVHLSNKWSFSAPLFENRKGIYKIIPIVQHFQKLMMKAVRISTLSWLTSMGTKVHNARYYWLLWHNEGWTFEHTCPLLSTQVHRRKSKIPAGCDELLLTKGKKAPRPLKRLLNNFNQRIRSKKFWSIFYLSRKKMLAFQLHQKNIFLSTRCFLFKWWLSTFFKTWLTRVLVRYAAEMDGVVGHSLLSQEFLWWWDLSSRVNIRPRCLKVIIDEAECCTFQPGSGNLFGWVI